MPTHDIIVAGASTGGVEALTALVGGLPADLPAAIFVVLHVPPTGSSLLPKILSRVGPLPATHANDGEPIHPGRIYVAPPDYHLLLKRGYVRVVRGPRENHHRPALDPLFRTAARAYGPRVIGVVLTGALDDGTAGLFAIKQCGGIAVVQDPAEAYFPSMPESALAYVDVDYRLPLAELAPLLARLAREPVVKEGATTVSREMDQEVRAAEWEIAVLEGEEPPGRLSSFTCPECHGPLYELRDGRLARFRCRIGHAFTAEGVLAEQSEAVEEALSMALNTLKESALMSRRLAREAQERGHVRVAARFEEKGRETSERAALIQRVLTNGGLSSASSMTNGDEETV